MIDRNILISIFNFIKALYQDWQGALKRLAGVFTIVYKKAYNLVSQALSLA